MKETHTTILKGLASPFLLLLLVFVPAGTWNYWQGWVYVLLSVIILFFTVWLLADKKDLIRERLSPGKGMKWWDKVYFAVSTPLSFISIVLAALDRGRFHVSVPLSHTSYTTAIAIFLIAHAIFLWAKYANRFFSSVVRIQTDRNQQVCTTGPYAIVRHPGYVGGMLFTSVTPFVLGSAWAWSIVPACAAAALLVVRTSFEDRTLLQELSGYANYAKHVRYRLIPFIY